MVVVVFVAICFSSLFLDCIWSKCLGLTHFRFNIFFLLNFPRLSLLAVSQVKHIYVTFVSTQAQNKKKHNVNINIHYFVFIHKKSSIMRETMCRLFFRFISYSLFYFALAFLVYWCVFHHKCKQILCTLIKLLSISWIEFYTGWYKDYVHLSLIEN